MTRLLSSYFAALLAMGLLDALWLGMVARSWYVQGMGHLMAERPNMAAAAAFYLLYPVGVMVFAVAPAGGEWLRAAALGALFGLFAYGTYDITNLAVMRDYPLRLALVDIAWGALASAGGAVAGAMAWRALTPAA